MMGLPDLGDRRIVRAADDTGGSVELRRDHDKAYLGRTTGAFFDEAQAAELTAAVNEIIAEGRAWRKEQNPDDGDDLGATAAETSGRNAEDVMQVRGRRAEPGPVDDRADLRRTFGDALAVAIEGTGMEAHVDAYDRVSEVRLQDGDSTGSYWIECDLEQAPGLRASAWPTRLTVTWEADAPVDGPGGDETDDDVDSDIPLDLTLSGAGARDPYTLAVLAMTAVHDHDAQRGAATRDTLEMTSRAEASREGGTGNLVTGKSHADGQEIVALTFPPQWPLYLGPPGPSSPRRGPGPAGGTVSQPRPSC